MAQPGEKWQMEVTNKADFQYNLKVITTHSVHLILCHVSEAGYISVQ